MQAIADRGWLAAEAHTGQQSSGRIVVALCVGKRSEEQHAVAGFTTHKQGSRHGSLDDLAQLASAAAACF